MYVYIYTQCKSPLQALNVEQFCSFEIPECFGVLETHTKHLAVWKETVVQVHRQIYPLDNTRLSFLFFFRALAVQGNLPG